MQFWSFLSKVAVTYCTYFSIFLIYSLRKKCPKYGVTSGLYFPVFGLEITPYLDTFHAVIAKDIVEWYCVMTVVLLKSGLIKTISMFYLLLFHTYFFRSIKSEDQTNTNWFLNNSDSSQVYFDLQSFGKYCFTVA